MDKATSFDRVVTILGIDSDQYKNSLPLKEWVRRNKDEKYVPTELLKHWGFTEDEAAQWYWRSPGRTPVPSPDLLTARRKDGGTGP